MQTQQSTHRAIKRFEKVYGKLHESVPLVPQKSNVGKEMKRVRQNLPIFDKQEMVMESINKNKV